MSTGKTRYGSTALHRACDNGHDKIVTLLLAHPDIDVNQKNNLDRLPSWWLVAMERPPVFNCCSRMPGSISMSLTMMDTPHFGMLLEDTLT